MNRKFVSVLFGLLLSFNVLSQEKELSIGLKFYPGGSNWYGGEYADLVSHQHSLRLSIGGGIEILKEIRNRCLYFETGILIMDRGYIDKTTSHYYTSPPNLPSSQRIEINKTISETLYYLTVPFSLISKKGWFYYGGGLNFSYFLKRNQSVNEELTDINRPLYSGDDNSYNRGKNIMIGLQLKTGLIKNINEKWSVRGELWTSATISPSFLNYGIGLGLDYNIN